MRLFTSDYRDGTAQLPFELQGFYFRILTYLHDGERVPADPAALATFLQCHPRTCRALVPKLIAAGKLYEVDGELRNKRVDRDLEPNSARVEADFEPTSNRTQPEVEPNSDRTFQKAESNQDPPKHTMEDSTSISTSRKEKPPNPRKRGKPDVSKLKILEAFEAYNATALRCGLAQAAKLTPDRQRKITARLRDYGLDGWNQALANIERSSFLTGANDRGWRANLEFLLQPSSFAKVHDGGYGNGRHAAEDRTYKPMKFFEPTPEELEAIRA